MNVPKTIVLTSAIQLAMDLRRDQFYIEMRNGIIELIEDGAFDAIKDEKSLIHLIEIWGEE